jgi:hypothetical protein
MSYNKFSNTTNTTNTTEIDRISSNPQVQQMIKQQLKIYGSINGICSAAYSVPSNKTNNSSSSYESQPTVGTSGKYMVHYYYGHQPGNKIVTVIG